MVRAVLYENDFAERFATITSLRCGILLGGLYDDEEHLILPIELPEKTDECGDRSGFNRSPTVIKEIDEKWVASHCKNLNRMLPGGVRISGICLVASSTEFHSSMDHVKRILFRLPKYESLIESTADFDPSERISLLVDPSTKKFSCWILDTASPNAVFRSIPIKQRSFLSSLRAFKTYINLSLETVLPADRKKEEILEKLQTAVKPHLQSLLMDAKLLVNGEFRGDTEPVLCDSPESSPPPKKTAGSKKKSGGHRRSKGGLVDLTDVQQGTSDTSEDQTPRQTSFWAPVDLIIFGPQFPRWQRASSSSSLDSGGSSETGYTAGTDATDSSGSGFVPINRLVISGRIPGIAFLPSTTTVQTLLQALRRDLAQGILARLELLTDELHITSAEFEVPRMCLPQRILVRLPTCPAFPLSDYKFLSETPEDVVARLHYFCVPMGAHSLCITTTLSRECEPSDLSAFKVDSPSAFSGQYPDVIPVSSRDQIDESCLDTSLEKSPEDTLDCYPKYTELSGTADQATQPIEQFISPSNPVIRWLTCLILVCAILLSFVFLGSKDRSSA